MGLPTNEYSKKLNLKVGLFTYFQILVIEMHAGFFFKNRLVKIKIIKSVFLFKNHWFN